ncbi:hypothetical protein MUK42_33963 [Musa troglodytarum]|uniref:Uncharacterized protein n=1 Tax=Musa troglodytarum TaxID=320322 RepID=A0A9E7FYF4_9LILI|nr:hypothetical protein MUK42_33963 [Musa troglodytarum]
MKHLAQTRRNPRNRGRQQQQKPQGGAAGDLLSPEMDVEERVGRNADRPLCSLQISYWLHYNRDRR